MGRLPKGPQLRWKDGAWRYRFTHNGQRYERVTGLQDKAAAQQEAMRVYADVLAGRDEQGPVEPIHAITMTEACARWLLAIESGYDPNTIQSFKTYVKAHWLRFFTDITKINDRAIEEYTYYRLGRVRRTTVIHELSALRNFTQWAERQRYLPQAPRIPAPGKKVLGKRAKHRELVELTEQEVLALVAALPEWGHARNGTHTEYPIRARFEFAWETGMRPEMIDKLRAPEHYRRGARELRLTKDIDKNRYARGLPLTSKARAALDRICPDKGLIFGEHEYRSSSAERRPRAASPRTAPPT
jgi:hypothetical protein